MSEVPSERRDPPVHEVDSSVLDDLCQAQRSLQLDPTDHNRPLLPMWDGGHGSQELWNIDWQGTVEGVPGGTTPTGALDYSVYSGVVNMLLEYLRADTRSDALPTPQDTLANLNAIPTSPSEAASVANRQKYGIVEGCRAGESRAKPEDDEESVQGIVAGEMLDNGNLLLTVTFLVSGFIIGPHGDSVRSIAAKTGTKISSWMERGRSKEYGKLRSFVLEGTQEKISHAVSIIALAVRRYKALTEGMYVGQIVDAVQVVSGVEFMYRPPPKRKVPQAASVANLGKE